MSEVRESRLREKLDEYRDELAAAADEADDQPQADLAEVLAALSRGEDPPREPARRVVERLEEG